MTALTAVAGTDAPGINVVPVNGRAHWDRVFAQVSFPHLTQAWSYGEGKRAQDWTVERLVFEGDRGPVALCQVLVRRVMGLPVIARINRGPLFMDAAPPAQIRLSVLCALRRRWRYGRHGLLLIAPALPADDESTAMLRAAGFLRRRAGGWGSALIDLEPSLEAIRASFSSKWRNHLNGSLKAGIEVRVRTDPEAFEWMLDCHARNMAAKGYVGPPVTFVRAMIASSPQNFCVVQGLIEGLPCSGILVASVGRHAETFLSWTGDAGRRTNAHHLLLWHTLMEMKTAGNSALDLGGYTTSDKYGAYKRGMKGKEYRLTGEWLAL